MMPTKVDRYSRKTKAMNGTTEDKSLKINRTETLTEVSVDDPERLIFMSKVKVNRFS